MTTTTVKAHCQICNRLIGVKTGVIAHHGYTRPGEGWQTASCYGAKHRAYEVACDAIDGAIRSCEAYIERTTAEIAAWDANPPETLKIVSFYKSTAWKTVYEDHARPEGFDPHGKRNDRHTMQVTYPEEFDATQSKRRRGIKATQDTIAFLTDRKAKWIAP